jgi:hypothetical protein
MEAACDRDTQLEQMIEAGDDRANGIDLLGCMPTSIWRD